MTQSCTNNLEEFLRQKTISPMTGIAKRLADLDLFSETIVMEPAIMVEAQAGVALCYILQGEAEKYDAITRNACSFLTDAHLLQFYKMLDISSLQDHIFETVIHNRAEIKQIRKTLLQDYKIEEVVKKSKVEEESDERKELLNLNEYHQYKTTRQLLGVSLLTNDLKKARKYSAQMKNHKGRVDSQTYLADLSAIQYLEERGFDVLRSRSKFRSGTNKYWWKDKCGKYGTYREFIRKTSEGITTKAAGALATKVLLYGATFWTLDALFGKLLSGAQARVSEWGTEAYQYIKYFVE